MKPLRRRLTLSHNGTRFLERWGLVHERLGGFYLHNITGADPGLDLHDHPWTFVSVVLRGGYTEELAQDSRQPERTVHRFCNRWSVHRVPLGHAHRITNARPSTWTLCFRGPTRRVWGFYLPRIGDGIFAEPARWVPWTSYDYGTRRANTVISNLTAAEMDHG